MRRRGRMKRGDRGDAVEKIKQLDCADFFGHRERAESNGSIPIRKSQKVIASLFLIFRKKMEQVRGIEPPWPAWKAGVLPLNYTCIDLTKIL